MVRYSNTRLMAWRESVLAATTGPWRRARRFLERDSVLAYLLIAPAGLWILGVVLYPLVFNVWVSLHAQRMAEAAPFVGLRNYGVALVSPEVWESLRLTLVWTFGNLALIVPLGLLTALLLNEPLRGIRVLRSWTLLPWMFPVVVIVLMWRWMLDPAAGVVNRQLMELGVISRGISFLGIDHAMKTVIAVNAWRWIPFMAIVLLAALQTVQNELTEAAAMDGANGWQQFRYIVLPQITPTLAITSFMLTMWLVNMFPPVWLMTQGGPAGATMTLPVKVYMEAFKLYRAGFASTLSVLLLLVLVVMVFGYFRLTRRIPMGEEVT